MFIKSQNVYKNEHPPPPVSRRKESSSLLEGPLSRGLPDVPLDSTDSFTSENFEEY